MSCGSVGCSYWTRPKCRTMRPPAEMSHPPGRHKNKMKPLKSRKERDVIRGSVATPAKCKKHHHHHSKKPRIKEKPHFRSIGRCNCSSPQRGEIRFAPIFPSAREPSMITDSRLIGHHGLFNHEVKSTDIARNDMGALHRLPTCDANAASPNDCVLTKGSSDLAMGQGDDNMPCQSNSHGSDLTPGQRPPPQPLIFSGSESRMLSPRKGPVNILKTKRKEANPSTPDTEKESQPNPRGNNREIRTINNCKEAQLNCSAAKGSIPKKRSHPHHRTLHWGPSPNLPPQPSSSPAAGTSGAFDARQPTQSLGRTSNFVSAVAAQLCRSLKILFISRSDLVSKSREVLLKALRERHGARLQENLLRLQQRLSFGHGTFQAQESPPPKIDPCRVSHVDEFSAMFQASKSDEPDLMFPQQTHLNLDQGVIWMTRPSMEKVGNLLDDLLSPSPCSQFFTGLCHTGPSLPDPFPSSCSGIQDSPSHLWEDGYSRARTRTSPCLGFIKNCSLNHSQAELEGRSGPRFRETGRYPFLPYPLRHPDSRRLHQEYSPLELGRCTTGFSSSAQYRWGNGQLRTFHHVADHPASSFTESRHSETVCYPPSVLLERSRSPPQTSSASPEPWSFPPMRLY